MKADSVKIADGVYWVGALDWDARDFHGFAVPGMTYNAYLVFGEEKVALIDNVYDGFFDEMWARIEDAFQKEDKEIRIDSFIINHIENDHIASIPDFLKKCPDVECYCTQAASMGIKRQHHCLKDHEFNVITTGDTLDLGGKSFTFVNAPMLHWPDSNFTLYNEEGILFSNDAFGQHICESKRYDLDVDPGYLELHTKRFYANLVQLSATMVLSKVAEMTEAGYLDNLTMIAPCHGQIWKEPGKVVDLYAKWAKGEADEKITIIYETMHHSTQKMAHQIVEGVMSEGVEAKMHFIRYDPESDILADILDSKAIILGVPTMMNNPYPKIGNLLSYLECVSPANTGVRKKAVVFSSKGWAGGAIPKLTTKLTEAGFDVLEDESIEEIYVPDEDDLDKCYELGKKVAQMVKEE